ncbi:MAG TPA: SIMPL domain-containing protein [Pyrinomonadaceae bacterium]|nr:SIMPL domain-containing protein [Pyrinomonadaceae bacterium]
MKQNVFKIVLLAVGLVLFAVTLYVYRPNQNKFTRITVVGDSQTKVAPDTAVITFSVVTQNKQALYAQQENAKKSETVKQAVEAITNNAKAEIKTSDYSLNPEQDYYSEKMPKIIGYEVKNTVTVSIDDLSQVGAVIDAATKAGANSVEGIQFVLGEASPAQGEALALATRQAMAKAEAIARSLNGKIVRVVETHEGSVPNFQPSAHSYAMTNANMMPAKPSYTTPVQAGSLNVRSQVVLIVEVEV